MTSKKISPNGLNDQVIQAIENLEVNPNQSCGDFFPQLTLFKAANLYLTYSIGLYKKDYTKNEWESKTTQLVQAMGEAFNNHLSNQYWGEIEQKISDKNNNIIRIDPTPEIPKQKIKLEDISNVAWDMKEVLTKSLNEIAKHYCETTLNSSTIKISGEDQKKLLGGKS